MTTSFCDLCGLPLRHGSVTHTFDGRTQRFCCQGCRMVYAMLLESADVDDPARFKETDLYRQCVTAGVIPAAEEDLIRIHRQETSKSPAASHLEAVNQVRPDRLGTLTLNLVVDGMWCSACAWVIEKAVGGLSGVEAATCHFSTDRLHCHYRPDRVAPDQIREAVARLGYTIREIDDLTNERQAQRRELVRLIISGLLSANVMMLSWALYAGFFTDLSGDAVAKISLPIVAMAVVVFIYGGGPMLRKAWFGLRHGAPGMETLVGMAAGCAFVYSLINWLLGSIHLYFDTACMLIVLVLLGKYLEQQAKGRVRRDLDSFFALQPAKVRVITNTGEMGRYVSIAHLTPGDRFAVEAGEIVPADGRVETGSVALDESALTGEPRLVAVKPGDPIKSGSRVVDGQMTATAQKVGRDTILGQMIAVMANSLERKPAFQGRTDRMLRWFVPVIIALAGSTGMVCAMKGLTLDQSLVRAVTVMVISCPCALGVAIPMAHLAGISLAGKGGILVRDIEAFERADSVDSLVFDKTGTLTQGRWQLQRIDCRPEYDAESILAWAAALERASDHEIARSITAYARKAGVQPSAAKSLDTYPEGVAGRVAGHLVRIGSRRFAWKGVPPEPCEPKPSERTPASLVFISVDDRPAARLVFGDEIRPGVAGLIDALKRNFGSVHLVSGDGEAATREVGRAVAIDHIRGALMPAEKADYIQALCEQGLRPAMVGDGVNDAAAMARAYLAVALHSGRGLAKEAAHITLMRGEPVQLLDFFPLSRRVNRKVVQNLWCAWIYNLVSIPVAMSGLLTPLVAATAMLLSSLTVIGNTLLLVRRT